MSARSEHRGRLAGKDLYGAPVATLAKRYGVRPTAIYRARKAAKRGPVGVVVCVDGDRWGALRGQDLTRPVRELAAECGVTRSAVHKARRAAGLTKPRAPKAGPVVAPELTVAPEPVATVVVASAPAFEDLDLVAAVDDELSICPAPYVAALIVAKRLRLPMDRVLVVAESRCGMAAK